jgi:PAS domain S-box-containing protein
MEEVPITTKSRPVWRWLRRWLAPPAPGGGGKAHTDDLAIFQALAKNALDAICITDPEGVITYVNPALYKLFGYDQEAEPLVGSPLIDLIPKRGRATFKRIMSLVREEGWSGEITLKHRDGSHFYVLLTVFPLYEAGESPKATVTILRDITDRVRAEMALRESEAKYRRLVESTTDWVWASDAKGVLTFSNGAIRGLLGYEVNDVVGTSVFEMIHPEDCDCVRNIVLDAAARKAVWMDVAIRWLHKDGSIRHFESSGQPIFDIEGNLVGFNGIDRDITERIQAEEALREERDFTAAVLDVVGALVVVLDGDGRIVRFNQACEETTGYTFEEVEGKRLWDGLLIPEEVDAVRDVFGELRAGQFPNTFENYWLARDGHRRLIAWSNTALIGADGTVKYVIGTGIDITERRRAEEALRESEARYHGLFVGVPTGLYRNTPAGQFIDVNPALVEMLGYPGREALLEANVSDLLVDPEEMNRGLSPTRRRGDPRQFEARVRRYNGEIIWVAGSSRGVRNNTGQILCYEGAVTDISERKRAVEAEREQHVLAEALRDSTAALTSTLNFEEVLERILTNVERVVPHAWADIMLIKGGIARIVRGRSVDPAANVDADVEWVIAQTPGLRRMVETRQAVVIPDTQAWDGWIETPETRWNRSYVGAPIIIEDRVIGFVNLSSTIPGFFTPDHAERLQAFADQAAIAIRNARLFRDITRQLGELQTLADASRIIASELDQDQLLEALYEQITRIAPADFYLIALYDKATNVVSVEVSVDEGTHYPKERYVLDRGLLELIIHNRQSLRFESLAEERHDLDIDIMQAGSSKACHGWLGVPMIYGDKVVGAIIVGSYERAAFDERHAQTLTSIANQAAVAIENARLYERIRRRQRYLEALHRVSRRAVPEQNPQQLMQAVVDALADEFGYQTAAIVLVDEDTRELKAVALASYDPVILQMKDDYRQSFDEGVLGWVVRHGEPYLTNDVALDSHYIPAPGSTPKGSELAVPIRQRGKTIGVFNVESPDAGAFDELDREALLELAEDFALYLENLVLADRLAEAAAEAERHRLARDLHDAVTQTLWSASLTADILPRIWERDPEEGRRRLESLSRLTRGALAEMRTLLLELRPTTLGGLKLNDLLRQFTTTITNRSGLPIELALVGDDEPPPDVKVGLYRIAQEAMNNVVKHANASQIMVCLHCEPDSVELVIKDDGSGFDLASIPPGHMGLEIARERAESIGATLEIVSQADCGTQVTVVWRAANQGEDAHV